MACENDESDRLRKPMHACGQSSINRPAATAACRHYVAEVCAQLNCAAANNGNQGVCKGYTHFIVSAL